MRFSSKHRRRTSSRRQRLDRNADFVVIDTAGTDSPIMRGLSSLDWVVVKNRARIAEKRQQDRVDSVLLEISERQDFCLLEPVRERVALRQLAPYGLTYSDLKMIGEAPSGDGRADSEIAGLVDDLRLPRRSIPPIRTHAPLPHRRAPVIERVGDAYREMLFNHA